MLLRTCRSILVTSGILTGSAVMAACPQGTIDNGVVDGQDVCTLRGAYTQDLILSSDKLWLLSGGVFIGGDNRDSAKLTIEPGTTIVGESGADFLVISRGSQIFAEGTRERPIVFTSAKPVGERRRGDWGGLVIKGNAPVNVCNNGGQFCEAEGEGNTGLFGGTDPFDNSGVLRYVRVEFAGFEVTPDDELNAITFQGVGSGTTVEFIQAHMGLDDGIEMFGGNVNIKYAVATGNLDDGFDWQLGWQGKAQFVIVEKYDDVGNHGIEADNFEVVMTALPRSFGELANFTIIGNPGPNSRGSGIVLRRGTGAAMYNFVVTNFSNACIEINDRETYSHGASVTGTTVQSTGLRMENSVVWCPNSRHFGGTQDLWNVADWYNSQSSNLIADPQLNGYVPKAGSPLLAQGITPFDLFFDEVDFIGAIRDAQSDWTVGWTTKARN